MPKIDPDTYTKDELVSLAEERGVDVPATANKAELADALNAPPTAPKAKVTKPARPLVKVAEEAARRDLAQTEGPK